MKNIFIHIGSFKTGSSAIQKFCHQNRSHLEKAGLHYPILGRRSRTSLNHSSLALSLIKKYGGYTPDWYSDNRTFSQIAEIFKHQISQTQAQNILISSEEFSRMPSLSSEQSASAVADLNKLLTNHNTKIIIYIRPPKDLLKSWYYEINKSTAPCRRFSQFVMLSPDYYILPIGSIHFWKKLVKPENIQILPYRDIGRGHIESFLQICGAEKIDIVDDFIINKSQASDKLERRRIDKVMAMKDKRERERYMARNMLESAAERKRLEKRIRHINREFSLFCEQHNIHLPCEDLTIDDVVAHEMAVNGNSKPLPQLVQWIRSFRYRPHVLRILRRIAGLYR